MQLENARKVRGIPPKKVILAEDFVKFNKNRNPTIPRSSMDTKIQKQEERYRKAKPSSNGLTPVKRSALWPRQWTQQQVILVSTPPPIFRTSIMTPPQRYQLQMPSILSSKLSVPANRGISPLCSWGSRTNTRQHFPQGAGSSLSRALPPGSYMLINPNRPFAPLAQGMEAASYHDDLCDISVFFFSCFTNSVY